ncbi:MAG: ATP-dependent acyl-CoA ligase [Spirochaetes bacterium]|nr:MAG: ATP-dependent acyl-CoA ligase [Spirochaetota bacterium]
MTRVIDDLPIFKCLGVKDLDPGKEAFIFVNDDGSDERISYGDIYSNTNRMSRILLKAGIGKGDTFALMMRNHAEFLYSLFAALSIGAIAVPIDPRSKGKKLSFQLMNTKTRGIVVSDEFMESLEEIGQDIHFMPVLGVVYKPEHRIPLSNSHPDLKELFSAESGDPPDGLVELNLKAPVQIIHTSGTTGDPKGVVLRADRFMTYALMAEFIWRYRSDDILYTGLSLTHGNAQSVTIFTAMAKKIPAVISERFTKSRIWDVCRKYGCTSFSLLGGMMSGIYNEPRRPNDGDNPVRTVISAGTPRAIWEDFQTRFGVSIHEWYGTVEGGLAHNPPGEGPVGSFGKPPEAFIEMKAVDEDDNEVLPNTRGELVSRMKSSATEVSYYGKEKESKEKTRGGWLRSGDICHRDENGYFYFDFRKGGGLRRQGDFIQPDYIEKIIGEHEGVSEVCVYGIPAESGAPGESDIVAAVAPFGDKKPDVAGIRQLCHSKLEKNSVPSFLQIVEEIPKTVTEKALDRLLRDAFRPDAPNVYKL